MPNSRIDFVVGLIVRLVTRAIAPPCAALALTAACSSSHTSDSGSTRVQPAIDLAAVALSVTIDARDELGAPRLIRAVAPRQAPAGMSPDEAARDHIAALLPLWIQHRRPCDLETRGVQHLRGGASIVRLQQQSDHVDLHQGEIRVMVQADGALAAVAGTMRASASPVGFASTPSAALDRALDALYGDARARPAITDGADKAGYRELVVADDPDVRVRAARARRELLPDREQLIAVWSVEVVAQRPGPDDAAESAVHRYLIADGDGRVVRDIDLTAADAFTYRVFADPSGLRNPLDGALASFNPHPTGVPDATLPAPVAADLVTIEAFNGPRDPWLPASATTTSGNNVDAFADIRLPLGFSDGDLRPSLVADRTFDHRYEFAAEPLATETQSMAAAVNVFYVTNWLHDWYYDSGFTEATGNAQVDNFGRGGVAGDPLIAHAQANAIGGSRDNANIATPDDGLSPEMNMFLWSGKATTRLTTPTAAPTTAAFLSGPRFFDVTGGVALAVDRVGGTHKACGRVTAAVSGRIAVVEFDGTCASATMVNNLRSAGAIGIIATISIPGSPPQILTGSTTANLPGVVIGFADGQALEAAIPATATIHRTTVIERDGDFDNAVIAHEWGHYLHHRLASCEAGACDAISEGWGDFTALHMMLRDTDDRSGTFGVALYALTGGGLGELAGFADPGYFGIRRFPYSTNRAKGLSFRHIADSAVLPDVPTNPGPARNPNSEVHNAGEVWAAMMWDAYNAVLDRHDHAEARRRMSDYVVAGLLLTPPDATFTESRDAILAAAGALDTDDMVEIAAAFAGRGAGTCAVSPGRASTTFAGVVESETLAARLETSDIALTDDGVSCDHDGYLDPGETGTLRIALANSGVLPADGVTVTAATMTPGVLLGRTLSVGRIAARSVVDIAIPVQLARSAQRSSQIDIAVHVESDAGCNTSTLAVQAHGRIGVDEKPAIATTDSIETKLLAWTPTGDLGGALWTRSADSTGNHVLSGTEVPFASDSQIVSPVLQASTTQPLVVTLHHAYNLAATQFPGVFFNGGVIEVSTDDGATWRDVNRLGVDPGYPGVISIDFISALSGRKVFGGKNALFPGLNTLSLNFGMQFAGRAVRLRFRLGTEACCSVSGWEIDELAVTGITNTPFPGFVPEPTICLGGTTTDGPGEASVIAVRAMPRYSLDAALRASE